MTETYGTGQVPGRIARRGLGLFALIGATLLAGCQMVPKPKAPPPPPAAAKPEVLAPLPTDTERHRIALLVPMTGPNAGVGQSIANATMMALFDSKTEKLRITTYDTGRGAAAAAQKAISEGNKLILGPLTAEEVRAVTPAARGTGVPVLSFSNDASVAGSGTYLLGFIPGQSVERVIGYAQSRGASQFAALVPKGVYGERAGNAFLRAAKARGVNAVALESFDRSPGGIAAAVKRLQQASSYDALLIADVGRVAAQVAPLVRANGGASAKILGTELWNAEASLGANPALRGAWFASVPDGFYRQFATKYRARYKAAPYRLASLGYDSVLLAARIARDWKAGTPFPTGMLADPDGFGGIDGVFRFDSDGIAQRGLEVQEVSATGAHIVDPAPRSFSGK